MKPTLGLRFEHPKQLKECLTNYGMANGYQLWYRRNDYRTLMVMCSRDISEGRSGGKKGYKRGLYSKKGKVESVQKGKGVQIGAPTKKGKGVQIGTPTKKEKGVQIGTPSKKGKRVQSVTW